MIIPYKEALGEAVRVLERGGIVVAPTDTLYGMLADATNPEAVRKLYEIRRPSGKPFLVLIPHEGWVREMCLRMPKEGEKLIKLEGVTLVLKKECERFSHVNRESIAVRVPRRGFVRDLISAFGKPLVAPSTNPEGKPPAKSVEEALSYFGSLVDLYVDAGIITGEPSTIVDLREGVRILREGRVKREEIEKVIGRRVL
ncbi:MAG: threonylcarbamoyl-AMP synthase [Aquificae bacterium]|nr:threonylcarbamoyl-AMP synthase [Aquificota bacterium]